MFGSLSRINGTRFKMINLCLSVSPTTEAEPFLTLHEVLVRLKHQTSPPSSCCLLVSPETFPGELSHGCMNVAHAPLRSLLQAFSNTVNKK